jgi:hypothetical protein
MKLYHWNLAGCSKAALLPLIKQNKNDEIVQVA